MNRFDIYSSFEPHALTTAFEQTLKELDEKMPGMQDRVSSSDNSPPYYSGLKFSISTKGRQDSAKRTIVNLYYNLTWENKSTLNPIDVEVNIFNRDICKLCHNPDDVKTAPHKIQKIQDACTPLFKARNMHIRFT